MPLWPKHTLERKSEPNTRQFAVLPTRNAWSGTTLRTGRYVAPVPIDDDQLRVAARTLAARLEPLVGQVYFSPEAHAAYVELGFAPSPGEFGGVAMPDGPAYFTSRGSLLGQVEPEVVAAAFGVFKPAVVVDGVRHGWSLTDAPTIFAARRAGAVAQLERVLGPAGDALGVGPDCSNGRSSRCAPRDDRCSPGCAASGTTRPTPGPASSISATCSASTAATPTSRPGRATGLDATEIGLLTEAYIGLPLRTYVRTRAWDDARARRGGRKRSKRAVGCRTTR